MTSGNSEIRPENGLATPEPDHGKTTTADEAAYRLEGDDEIFTAADVVEAAFPPQQARPGATQTVPAIDDTGEGGSAPQIRAPRGFTCGGCPDPPRPTASEITRWLVPTSFPAIFGKGTAPAHPVTVRGSS